MVLVSDLPLLLKPPHILLYSLLVLFFPSSLISYHTPLAYHSCWHSLLTQLDLSIPSIIHLRLTSRPPSERAMADRSNAGWRRSSSSEDAYGLYDEGPAGGPSQLSLTNEDALPHPDGMSYPASNCSPPTCLQRHTSQQQPTRRQMQQDRHLHHAVDQLRQLHGEGGIITGSVTRSMILLCVSYNSLPLSSRMSSIFGSIQAFVSSRTVSFHLSSPGTPS